MTSKKFISRSQPTDADKTGISQLSSYLASLNLNLDAKPEEHDYNNAVLIVSDAVLSINRKYKEFVLPRIDLIRKSHLISLELSAVIDEIDGSGRQSFCNLWNYNHLERVDLLRAVCVRFLIFKSKSGQPNDLEALRLWGKSATAEDYLDFKVPGLGFATFQYLRILCGADTVKPDIHLRNAFEEGVGRKVNDLQIVSLYEATAYRLQIPARKLDYAIWEFYSERARSKRSCSA